MFKRKTLFVVGAGASAEANLPVGSKLADTISNKLDVRLTDEMNNIGQGDMGLYYHFRQTYPQHINEYQVAGWSIRDGIRLSHSIDDFLDLHSKNEQLIRIGKAAIVKSILEAERGSLLYYERNKGEHTFDLSQLQGTWFVKFMQMLGRGMPRENVRQIFGSVAFVIFNYDRCLEHFLLHALPTLYNISENDAYDIVGDLHIIHPYGSIGELDGPSNRGGLPFGGGGGRLSAHYIHLSDQIKTYTEQITDETLLSQISEAVLRAECIVFLGFAYHDQNMRLLAPTKKMPHKFVFGTAWGMSDADTNVIKDQLSTLFTPNMTSTVKSERLKIEYKLKCTDLFDYYAKSLPGIS
jgi:hypothetical protein